VSYALHPDQVLAVIQLAVATVLEIEPSTVTRELRFDQDLQADSLALVEIVEIVEEQLTPVARPGFVIDDEDLDGLLTVGQALDYALARI
jgi:acyl carrier protein